MSAADWVQTFGPIDDGGEPIPVEDQPLTHDLRRNRPGHYRHRIRSLAGGKEYDDEVSGVPVIGGDGFVGALVFFWVAGEPLP